MHPVIQQAPPAEPTFTEAIAQIKRSVTPVVCIQLPGPGGPVEPTLVSVEGTAFFLRTDGSFATAGHIIRDLTNPSRVTKCPTAAIYLPRNGWQPRAANFRIEYFYFSAADCTRDDDLDIAVCRCPRNIKGVLNEDPRPVRLNTAIQDDGAPAAFTGFPLSTVVPLTSRGFTAAYRGALNEVDGPRELVIDKSAWPGASGSPIYLEDGSVIAIVIQRGIGDAAGMLMGRPAFFIDRLLSQRQTVK
jgi:hypothetical protein